MTICCSIKCLCCPLTKSCSLLRINSIAYSNDDFQCTKSYIVLHLSVSFCLNYPNFPDSFLFYALFEYLPYTMIVTV